LPPAPARQCFLQGQRVFGLIKGNPALYWQSAWYAVTYILACCYLTSQSRSVNAGNKLYLLVTEPDRCEQLAQSGYLTVTPYSLHHQARQDTLVTVSSSIIDSGVCSCVPYTHFPINRMLTFSNNNKTHSFANCNTEGRNYKPEHVVSD